MRMIFSGPLWDGSTALQRLNGFRAIRDLDVHWLDSGIRIRTAGHTPRSIWRSFRSKLGWPADASRERARLSAMTKEVRPDVVFVDSSRVLTGGDLRRMRKSSRALLSYYVPDNVVAKHNASRQLASTFPEWDVFFTTKSFNVPELKEMGVRRPILIGKAFDPQLHRPLTPTEAGPEFERYDVVFMGAYERERIVSVNRLARAGFSVIVFSNDWPAADTDSRVELRRIAFGEEYVRGMHVGKIGLCFLRKINRDRITQRSMEIPAMRRPMVAERTEEHDAHFEHGREYLGFRDDDELVAHVTSLLHDEGAREKLAAAGRQRCLSSGYSTIDRAHQMFGVITSTMLDSQ